MKEYIVPMVEIIELPENDVIATSGNPGGTGEDTEMSQESIFGTSARNGMRFD